MEIQGLSDVLQYIASFDYRVWVGAITAFVVFIIEIKLEKKGIILSRGKKKIEKAEELGHVIEGKLVKTTHSDSESDTGADRRYYSGYYEYEVNGEIRKKKVTSENMPSLNIWLYYIDSPDKVFSKRDVSPGCSKFLIYIIPILAAYFVMTFLGY